MTCYPRTFSPSESYPNGALSPPSLHDQQNFPAPVFSLTPLLFFFSPTFIFSGRIGFKCYGTGASFKFFFSLPQLGAPLCREFSLNFLRCGWFQIQFILFLCFVTLPHGFGVFNACPVLLSF